MKAIWQEHIIAESDNTVVVEGNHYFPKTSLKNEYFKPSDYTTACGWKGTANYYSVVVGDHVNENAAWYYAQPKSAAKDIAEHVAFWRGVQVVE